MRTPKLGRFYFDWTLMEKPLRRRASSGPSRSTRSTVCASRSGCWRTKACRMSSRATRGSPRRRAARCRCGPATTDRSCIAPTRHAIPNSVTAVLMPEGYNSDLLRSTARHRFNVSLGGGLGRLGGKIFRIGHLGDLNEPMLLGALSAVEMSLRINNIPHGRGGVEAAMDYLAALGHVPTCNVMVTDARRSSRCSAVSYRSAAPAPASPRSRIAPADGPRERNRPVQVPSAAAEWLCA